MTEIYTENEIEENECEVCGKANDTVEWRICGYHKDVNNTEVHELICDDCENQHILDI